MFSSPKGERTTIVIAGRRNSGKSSIVNALAGQEVSLVSHIPGTTTDPVDKAMELSDMGPVLFVDTGGLDDSGQLGDMRVKKTRDVIADADILLLIIDAQRGISDYEEEIIRFSKENSLPLLAVINKVDLNPAVDFELDRNAPVVKASAKEGMGINDIKESLIKIRNESLQSRNILEGLVKENDELILVVPIDKGAPKGRLILPQVQVIRAALDMGARALVVRDTELEGAVNTIKNPRLVITDSQAFKKVADVIPEEMPLTSFSIIFAGYKGDLDVFFKGIETLKTLKPGDNILILEACTHHPSNHDIGKVKIPAMLEELAGGKLNFCWNAGRDMPDNLGDYRLVVHCGGCMSTRKSMLTRLQRLEKAGVPVINYGMFIAYFNGILSRAIEPFS